MRRIYKEQSEQRAFVDEVAEEFVDQLLDSMVEFSEEGAQEMGYVARKAMIRYAKDKLPEDVLVGFLKGFNGNKIK